MRTAITFSAHLLSPAIVTLFCYACIFSPKKKPLMSDFEN